ncbi:hypothetical protein tb265_01550 [Gemmatimonadetes bacterium T265]|nr:hypothetical protein tb265_01550 [Gemmatimonadetes bacterium T265]
MPVATPPPPARAPDPLAARTAADVRERFLRDALARVPADRVVEAHVFAPMRQGGVESGVAVLAATPAAAAEDATEAPAHRGRHTVYVARYRLALKGPERGRWDVAVREEADAPLLTVDAVVRGVGRRANDAADAVRLDAAALRGLAAPPGPPDLLAGPPASR